jgi:hypothetical protein
MRRILIVLAAVVVLGAVAYVGLTSLVEVAPHRNALEGALEAATGWSARIETIEMQAFPTPGIALGGVTLEAADGATSMTASRAVVSAPLFALFGRRLEIDKIELLRPTFRVLRPEAGEPWPRPWSAAGGAAERLDELHVAGGRLEILREPGAEAAPLLEDVSLVLVPSTGRVWGRAHVTGERGTVRWLGMVGEGLELTLSRVELTALVGDPTGLRPWSAARVDGTMRIPGESETSTGEIEVRGLALSAGRPALSTAGWQVRVSSDPRGGWWVRAASSVGADAEGEALLLDEEVSASLRLTGGLDALAPWIAATAGVPIELEGGTGRLTFEVKGDPRERLGRSFEALVEDSRARIAGRGTWRELAVDEALVVSGAGGRELEVRVRGRMGGGTLSADAIVPLAADDADFVIGGELRDASWSALAEALGTGWSTLEAAPAVVTGELATRLAGPATSPRGLRGSVRVATPELDVGGWPVARAIAEHVAERAPRPEPEEPEEPGEAGEILGRDDDRPVPPPPPRRPPLEMPDDEVFALEATLEPVAAGTHWLARRVLLDGERVRLEGSGTLESDELVLDVRATLAPSFLEALAAHHPELEELTSVYTLRVEGPPGAPRVVVDDPLEERAAETLAP